MAAGGVDVVAFFEAEGGLDAGVVEDGVEGAAVGLGRAAPVEALDGVVGDEVDLGVEAAGVAGEEAGLVEVVVDALDEDVFEGELLFFAAVPVVEGVEELGERALRLTGMMRSRTSSVAPWSEMARRICCGWSASCRISGTRPEVEMVRWRAPMWRPHGAVMIFEGRAGRRGWRGVRPCP